MSKKIEKTIEKTEKSERISNEESKMMNYRENVSIKDLFGLNYPFFVREVNNI